jgi:hypothetical protein
MVFSFLLHHTIIEAINSIQISFLIKFHFKDFSSQIIYLPLKLLSSSLFYIHVLAHFNDPNSQ